VIVTVIVLMIVIVIAVIVKPFWSGGFTWIPERESDLAPVKPAWMWPSMPLH